MNHLIQAIKEKPSHVFSINLMSFIDEARIRSIISTRNDQPWSSSPKPGLAEAKLLVKTEVSRHLNW